jgi:protein O-GlcNAc transferase
MWRNFVGAPGEEVERMIRADAPDILIDLAGHTCMTCRLPLFARRLAPVQVTYLGYPDTTGVPAMDYRFTDATADPAPDADRLATERLMRFSSTAWAYQPPADAPAVACAPRQEPFTFGCFNDPGKITDSLLGHWGRLLEAVPGSRLVLKGSGFGNPDIRSGHIERMARMNLDPARVELLERTPSIAAHLAQYSRVDVALDSFPYNGTTTTCEALWMGVPVVSLEGDRHVSRVGASLLRAAGHPEWVARDPQDYVRVAAALASDPGRLAVLRGSLRGELEQSALLDHQGQAERFGRALRACWEASCARRQDAA